MSRSLIPCLLVTLVTAGCITTLSAPEALQVPAADPARQEAKRRMVSVDFPQGVTRKNWIDAWTAVAQERIDLDIRLDGTAAGDADTHLHFFELEQREAPLSLLSGLISTLTATLIPGFTKDTRPIQVHLEAKLPDRGSVQAVIPSEYALHTYIWLPFAVRSPNRMSEERKQLALDGQKAVVRRVLQETDRVLAGR